MKFYIVDVFAEKKYSGNQLAVCILDEPISSKKMQKIAREFNFSETTFVNPKKKNGCYKTRIFTPDTEVQFAGHPTLGTAFICNEILEGGKAKKIRLKLPIGKIPVTVKGEYYEMKQKQPTFGDTYLNRQIADILSIASEDINPSYPVMNVSTGLGAAIIPVKNEAILKKITVDHHEYKKFLDEYGPCNLLAFYVKKKDQIKCRVFVDDTGYGEDPATGSANGNLAAYLLQNNFLKSKDLEYTVEQGEEANRPSLLYVKAKQIDNHFDIRVGGKVFMIAKGEI